MFYLENTYFCRLFEYYLMEKVLIISYYWPPAGGPGVQRWLKLSKYLPKFGILPFVLTVKPEKANYPLKDESLGKDVHPDIKVFSTDSFEILNIYKKARITNSIPTSGFANENEKINFIGKVFRGIRGNLFLPDARRGWNRYAYKMAVKIIEEHQINKIITTGPPHSTHLVGLKLKKNKPTLNWIADFRDPWSDIFYNEMLYQTALALKWNRSYEKKVLLTADKVITVGEYLKKHLIKNTKNKLSAEQIIVIPNGYDPDDFKNLSKETQNEKFTLIYLGTATKDYPFKDLLQVIEELNKTENVEICLEIVGVIDNVVDDLLQNFDATIAIIKTPYIPHDEVAKKLAEADGLVLLLPQMKNNELIISGKLFEYLAVERPIICIGPKEGEASIIIERSSAGEVIDFGDKKALRSLLLEIYNHTRSFEFHTKEYSREFQARQLATLLKKE